MNFSLELFIFIFLFIIAEYLLIKRFSGKALAFLAADKEKIKSLAPKPLLSIPGTVITIALTIAFLYAVLTYNSPNRTYVHQDQAMHSPLPPGEDDKTNPSSEKTFYTIYSPQDIKTTFEDVAGLKTVKEEVKDIIYYLRAPDKFTRLGAKPPKGMIIEGEPGTGKTLLARSLAGEAGVSFIATSGSSFEDTYIGVGASRIRELFDRARRLKPCILFIDEIDSVAKNRDTLFMQNLTQTQTINQLLSEMDGLDPKENNGVFVIAATNRIEDLDKAILRPGRFDRKVHIGLPTRKEREEILDLYVDKIIANDSVETPTLAKMTTGFSGADLAELVNEAAIYATKQDLSAVDNKSFEIAKEKIILGLENPSMVITSDELEMTAYHEAGHTIVGSILMPKDESVYKVTITPRGASLGATHFIPEVSKQSYSRSFLENKIAMLLAGRVAEEIIYGQENASTGASSDFKSATEIAYNMVTKWGFSDKIGPIYQDKNNTLLKQEIVQEETQKILSSAHKKAMSILISRKYTLDKLAKALIEHETLDRTQVKKIIASVK
ncbi:MAG: ATP-dependent zinc metalloprotease FtsH [Francisellaceae bacterium]|nr:ATP-dependent zinc metalloprotease FtsH [Francisellaceae bacterium]